MTKIKSMASVLMGTALLLILLISPRPVYASWPPFSFELTPLHQDGKIIYTLQFYKRVENALTDVVFKIPLPEGTRFLEANAQPTTRVSFDGAEITFFTATVHRPIRNAYFVVEVTNPEQRIFITQPWIAWQGDEPGSYLMDEVSLDLTRQALNWDRPRSRLRLEAGAIVQDNMITYAIYPKNIGERRMWDLQVKVPLPAGTTLLSAQAPPPFVTDFDGQEVTFSTLELARRAEVGPLTVQVSAQGVSDSPVVIHTWATWKNVGRRVGRDVAPEEWVRTGNLVAQPHSGQQVVADSIGDTPFANYDLTSIALEEDDATLKIIFHTVEAMGPGGQPLEFILYIDSDCRLETGGKRGNRGAEYWVRYKHQQGQARIYRWNGAENGWGNAQKIEADNSMDDRTVQVWVPFDLLENDRQFCWLGRGRNRTETFAPGPPNEWVGVEPRLTQYEAVE